MTPAQFTRSVRSLNRLRQIAQVLTRHGFGYIVAQINLAGYVPVWMLRKKGAVRTVEESGAALGKRLARVCAEIGPTFIKLGQMVSTRRDILPGDVADGLRSLQDEVPPFDTSQAMEVIAKDLGQPVDACYTWISEQPIASASIGQVYRARGLEKEDLVVKVRRPDIENVIRLDMQLLHWMAESVERLMPELRIYRPTMIVDELDQMLTRELDYINEAATTARFADAFREDTGIRIPEVHWELTGPRVLTLQAIQGRNVLSLLNGAGSSGGGIDRPLVARRLAECYLKQIFELGTFHADPHPGNILVEPPGRVGLIDFGQVGTITDDFMTDLVTLTYAAVHQEMEVMVDALADMGTLGRDTDRRGLARSLRVVLDKYRGLPIKRLDLGAVLAETSDIMRRHDVTVHRDLAVLFKALGVVSTVTARLDPSMNLLELIAPRIRDIVRERLSPARLARSTAVLGWDLLSILRHAPGQLRQGLRRLASGAWELQVRHENIDRLVRELDRSSNRLAFSVVIAAIIIGSSFVFSADTEFRILGVEVRYFGVVGYVIAGVMGLGLSWAIFRSGRLH